MSEDQESVRLELADAGQKLLLETFRQNTLECAPEGEWVQIRTAALKIRCVVDKWQSSPKGSMIQASFDVQLPDEGLVIRDTLVGVGDSCATALREAVISWFDGVFLPVQGALCATDANLHVYDISAVNMQRQEQSAWEAYAGPFQIRGPAEWHENLAQHLEESAPLVTLLINPLTDLLADSQDQYVWVKLLLQQQPNDRPTVECKANNLNWPEGHKELFNFQWPPVSAGMLWKQFIMIKRGQTQKIAAPAAASSGKVRGCATIVIVGLALAWLATRLWAAW